MGRHKKVANIDITVDNLDNQEEVIDETNNEVIIDNQEEMYLIKQDVLNIKKNTKLSKKEIYARWKAYPIEFAKFLYNKYTKENIFTKI